MLYRASSLPLAASTKSRYASESFGATTSASYALTTACIVGNATSLLCCGSVIPATPSWVQPRARLCALIWESVFVTPVWLAAVIHARIGDIVVPPASEVARVRLDEAYATFQPPAF